MAHDVHEFLRRSQQDLQAEYLRIRTRSSEDPGTAGDQGEENWASLLRAWLPQYFHVVTKCRILTESGYASPQIDVLVRSPAYPRLLLDKELFLSGGVVAAFECKVTLTAADVRQAVTTSATLKAALPKRDGTPYRELNCGLIYGLLAHSHIWQAVNSRPLENIENALWTSDEAAVNHPNQCLDVICVADLATWLVIKLTYLSSLLPFYNEAVQEVYGPKGSGTTSYMCAAIGADRQADYFSPVGALLSRLLSQLAWNFPDMRALEEYFRKVDVLGSGHGRMRLWSIDIYSEKIRDRVYRGELSNGVPYDEWAVAF